MSAITKVAIAGAKGNLGDAVLEQLLKAGFQVTALTRQGSSHTFPSTVTVKPVDYTSQDSLVNSLQGQDAVVATLASEALDVQIPLIDASVKAGVKRFITSDFGSDTFNPKTSALPGFASKITVHNAAKKAAAESGLTWTAIINGPFLNWGVTVEFLAKSKSKEIDYPDGGDQKYSVSNLETVGKAVVGVLKNLEATKNRPVYIQDATISQKQLAGYLKKAVGADGWKENVISIAEGLQQGEEELKKPQPNGFFVFITSLRAAVWGEGYGGRFTKLDNDLFGIKQLTDAEVEEVVIKSVPK
ncbi:NAD(P)-binding protein [Annulohypoxylon maeteangense]|uniref:NAD(P)-binding protein n=1 Tax=Annulohypoxylon maeteangense TaxID=1927788 RepID=UPI0020074EA3|nr:NAD(P)-binding protein [Annulohypoxylon maeteangense]KAI0880490.1 NAD(P)-binding protein [Annulohypoxylon maeteangense]